MFFRKQYFSIVLWIPLSFSLGSPFLSLSLLSSEMEKSWNEIWNLQMYELRNYGWRCQQNESPIRLCAPANSAWLNKRQPTHTQKFTSTKFQKSQNDFPQCIQDENPKCVYKINELQEPSPMLYIRYAFWIIHSTNSNIKKKKKKIFQRRTKKLTFCSHKLNKMFCLIILLLRLCCV